MRTQVVYQLAVREVATNGVVGLQDLHGTDAEASARSRCGRLVIGGAVCCCSSVSQSGAFLRRHVDGLV